LQFSHQPTDFPFYLSPADAYTDIEKGKRTLSKRGKAVKVLIFDFPSALTTQKGFLKSLLKLGSQHRNREKNRSKGKLNKVDE
jgi:hypothetical protein